MQSITSLHFSPMQRIVLGMLWTRHKKVWVDGLNQPPLPSQRQASMGQEWIGAGPCRLTGAVRRCWGQSGACARRHMPACTPEPHRHAAKDCPFQVKAS